MHYRRIALALAIAMLAILAAQPARALDKPIDIVFDGKLDYHKIPIAEIGPGTPADWSGFEFLVFEMKVSSPQRMILFINTADGPRRIGFQPFGQNVWLRASVPLQYFKGQVAGNDLAAATNRRTDSFWMSVWGPFGPLTKVESIGLMSEYPVGKPRLEIRAISLAKEDPGSDFLEGKPVLDEFGQWAHADWPHKIKSAAQLQKELADESAALSPEGYGYAPTGGYANTTAKATGFFRVEQIDGKWWFIDPQGHHFLSTGSNGAGAGFGAGGGGRGGRRGGRGGGDGASTATQQAANQLLTRRLAGWGLTTGGVGRPNTAFLRWPNTEVAYLGMSDIYAADWAARIDESAQQQCVPRKDDPLLLGYYVGNEPPWADRESELADMWLNGPDCATKTALKEFLAKGDTPARRKEFMFTSFEKYLKTIVDAIKKYDPNHITLGIRLGGEIPDEMLKAASVFDVCSINIYEYDATAKVKRAYEVSGRPILIGEFHIGVPADGLGAGLVQARDQIERGKAYRYFVEQAATVPGFVGAHWFTWRDEPVLGRGDGENYNIGFVDVTNRPYPEFVEAVKASMKALQAVHAGKSPAFAEKALASDAGAPGSPWKTGWEEVIGYVPPKAVK